MPVQSLEPPNLCIFPGFDASMIIIIIPCIKHLDLGPSWENGEPTHRNVSSENIGRNQVCATKVQSWSSPSGQTILLRDYHYSGNLGNSRSR